jgi:hypothetical protein
MHDKRLAFSVMFSYFLFFSLLGSEAPAQEWKTRDLLPLTNKDTFPITGMYLEEGLELPQRTIDRSGDTLKAFQWKVPVFNALTREKYTVNLTLYAGRNKDTVTLVFPNAGVPGKNTFRMRLHVSNKHKEVPLPFPEIEKMGHRLHLAYVAAADTPKTVWWPRLKVDHGQKARVKLEQFNGWLIREFIKGGDGYLSGLQVFRFVADKPGDRLTGISPLDNYLHGDTLVVKNLLYRLTQSNGFVSLSPLPANTPYPTGGKLGYRMPIPDMVRYVQRDTVSYDTLSYRYFVHMWCPGCFLSYQPYEAINRLAPAMLEKHNTKWLHVTNGIDSSLLRKQLTEVPLEGDVHSGVELDISWGLLLGTRKHPTWFWLNKEGVIVWKGVGENDFMAWEKFVMGR